MPTKLFRFFDNTGGLNLRYHDTLLADTDAEEIENLHFTSNGAWSSHDVGYRTLNTSPMATGATVTGLVQFKTETVQSHLVAAAGTKLYTISPGDGTLTQRHTGLTTTTTPMTFVTFQGILIGFNGQDTPITWDGINDPVSLNGWSPAITGLSVGKPSFGAVYANRLVVAGDSDNPSMLYISELENPERFTPESIPTDASAGAIQVSPGDGQHITGLKTLYLPLENQEVLLVFKEFSTYMLTGTTASEFTISQISSEFDAVNHNSIVLVGNDVMFLSAEGITSLSTATLQGNLTTQFVSRNLQPQINRLNSYQLHHSVAIHLRHRNEVWWCVPDGGNTQNQRILVMNYGENKPIWSRRSGITAASAVVLNNTLYTGTYTGFLQQQLVGSNYDGDPIDWTYRTPFYDFGAPRQRKRIREVELYLKQLTQATLTVTSAWDIRRNTAAQETRQLATTPDVGSALFGTATYGSDTYGLAGVAIVALSPNGSGRQCGGYAHRTARLDDYHLVWWTQIVVYHASGPAPNRR